MILSKWLTLDAQRQTIEGAGSFVIPWRLLMRSAHPSEARPIYRLLAGMMAAVTCLAVYIGAVEFYAKRDVGSAFVLYAALLGSYVFGTVMVTGRWIWRLPHERRGAAKSVS